ncbi:hypothetical protein NDU88_001019 [Pleurodeles waltl]|uniref:Uncharacterized protein n=1 Tax=Pleurodeles waltl TaxID=8319 RepID=A0AAV7V8J8_PLEWA|nr:hypothetical protein NDU88_001019 [Pleurodeles waltl]
MIIICTGRIEFICPSLPRPVGRVLAAAGAAVAGSPAWPRLGGLPRGAAVVDTEKNALLAGAKQRVCHVGSRGPDTTLCSPERSSASITWGSAGSETACLPRGATRLHIALRLLEEAADVLKEERQAERCPGKGLSCN